MKECPECGEPHSNKKYCSKECLYSSQRKDLSKECENCGEVFRVSSTSELDRRTYCSNDCMYDSFKERVKCECDYCGDKIEKRKYEMERREGTYCDTECAKNDRKKRVNRKCNQCGENFEVRESQLRRNRGKYCSKKCHNKSKKDGEKIECEKCGDVIWVKKSLLEKNDKHFCNRKCYNSYRTVKMDCENCGETFQCGRTEYMDGRKYCGMSCRIESGENLDINWVSEYGDMWHKSRYEALERDEWECVECGMSQSKSKSEFGVGLHVHHKKPYSEFDKDKNAHKLDNLVSLCASCHRKEETQL